MIWVSTQEGLRTTKAQTSRAVIVIDNINVSIKKSCNIHIDTEMWISIFIDIGSKKKCCFLPVGLQTASAQTDQRIFIRSLESIISKLATSEISIF